MREKYTLQELPCKGSPRFFSKWWDLRFFFRIYASKVLHAGCWWDILPIGYQHSSMTGPERAQHCQQMSLWIARDKPRWMGSVSTKKKCVYTVLTCPHPSPFTYPYPLTSHARPHLSPLSQAARHTMPAWITSNGPAGPVQGPPPITWKPWPGCPWWPWWPWRGFYLTEWITLNNHKTDIVR